MDQEEDIEEENWEEIFEIPKPKKNKITVETPKKGLKENVTTGTKNEGKGLHENTKTGAYTRAIIHIDIDCFYAQVEMINNPELRDKPLGIQQKYLLVTCNYEARKYGVTKLMRITDAKEKCPNIVIVNGEDLTKYREMSRKITDLLCKYSNKVERLGFDENFMDVTYLIETPPWCDAEPKAEGHIYGLSDIDEHNIKEYHLRLSIASQIAADIRQSLHTELGITSCAGIAHNKLLAKLVGGAHKPNQQTLLFPEQTRQLMQSFDKLRSIPGIGHSTIKRLKMLNINSVDELSKSPPEKLTPEFGESQSKLMVDLCNGVDNSEVVIGSALPQTMSDEDSFRKCSDIRDAEIKITELLASLLTRLLSDGRLPQTLRLTIRRFTEVNRYTNRESRQCPIPGHVFTNFTMDNLERIKAKLVKLSMELFAKLVNTKQSFHLTLINVCFAKFTENGNSKSSARSFFFSSPKKTQIKDIDEGSNCLSPTEVVRGKIQDCPRKDRNYNELNVDADTSCSVVSCNSKMQIDCNTIFEDKNLNANQSIVKNIAVVNKRSEVKKHGSKSGLPGCKQNEKKELVVKSLPTGIDAVAFAELPKEIQQEILAQHQAVSPVKTRSKRKRASFALGSAPPNDSPKRKQRISSADDSVLATPVVKDYSNKRQDLSSSVPAEICDEIGKPEKCVEMATEIRSPKCNVSKTAPDTYDKSSSNLTDRSKEKNLKCDSKDISANMKTSPSQMDCGHNDNSRVDTPWDPNIFAIADIPFGAIFVNPSYMSRQSECTYELAKSTNDIGLAPNTTVTTDELENSTESETSTTTDCSLSQCTNSENVDMPCPQLQDDIQTISAAAETVERAAEQVNVCDVKGSAGKVSRKRLVDNFNDNQIYTEPDCEITEEENVHTNESESDNSVENSSRLENSNDILDQVDKLAQHTSPKHVTPQSLLSFPLQPDIVVINTTCDVQDLSQSSSKDGTLDDEDIVIPEGFDKSVFMELPKDIQESLVSEYESSKQSKTCSNKVLKSQTPPLPSVEFGESKPKLAPIVSKPHSCDTITHPLPSSSTSNPSSYHGSDDIPPNIDRHVFSQLPTEVQNSVISEWKESSQSQHANHMSRHNVAERDSDIFVPPNIDRAVYLELPPDVQKSLYHEWKTKNEFDTMKRNRNLKGKSPASKSPRSSVRNISSFFKSK